MISAFEIPFQLFSTSHELFWGLTLPAQTTDNPTRVPDIGINPPPDIALLDNSGFGKTTKVVSNGANSIVAIAASTINKVSVYSTDELLFYCVFTQVSHALNLLQ